MGGMSLSLIEQVSRAHVPAAAFVQDDWLVYGPRVDPWMRAHRRSDRAAQRAEKRVGIPLPDRVLPRRLDLASGRGLARGDSARA